MTIKKYSNFFAIATLLAMTVSTTITAEAAEINGGKYSSNGVVKFVPNTNGTDPLDPENPLDPSDPTDPTNPDGPNKGTSGPLSLDFASSLDFGINKISSKDEIYYANPQTYNDKDKVTANYVQISDNRGSSAGWSLKVKQEKQFENSEAKYSELKGAEVRINDSKTVSNSIGVDEPTVKDNIILEPGIVVDVMNAKLGAGDGTWISRFGNIEKVLIEQEDKSTKEIEKNTSVQLNVPGSTPKSAVEYRSSLMWILSEVASNE